MSLGGLRGLVRIVQGGGSSSLCCRSLASALPRLERSVCCPRERGLGRAWGVRSMSSGGADKEGEKEWIFKRKAQGHEDPAELVETESTTPILDEYARNGDPDLLEKILAMSTDAIPARAGPRLSRHKKRMRLKRNRITVQRKTGAAQKKAAKNLRMVKIRERFLRDMAMLREAHEREETFKRVKANRAQAAAHHAATMAATPSAEIIGEFREVNPAS